MLSAEEHRCRLHTRVRSFIEASARGDAAAESFDGLGLAVLRYQADHVAAYQRLLARAGRDPGRVSEVRVLPAVPSDAFRFARIAAHPPADDVALFRTSGTTALPRGEHALSTTETYECSALAWGGWALFCDIHEPLTAIILSPRENPESSLHFMMKTFAARFAPKAHYLQTSDLSAIDADELERACDAAARAGAPAIVMGTSFAFVHALDALGGRRLQLPQASRAMHTGGFKGRSRAVDARELRGHIAQTFGVSEGAVVGEYGMTELSSQLYEGTLRGQRGFDTPSATHGTFIPPPWMRVAAVDPETLLPLADGEVGILRFEDLVNVDGALAIQTADRGRCTSAGVELMGRSPGAPPRGCSLALENLLENG